VLRISNIVFGPFHSRRLGLSLGVNISPTEGKLCNFDCIYCECGWNADGRTIRPMPSPQQVGEELSAKLQSIASEGGVVDSITFSGNGEPTLHPEFPAIVDVVLRLRDELAPSARISVLSNATTLLHPEVRAALRRVDSPILKLDAPTDALMRSIDRPCTGMTVQDIVEGMKLMEGEFIMQTMFLHGAEPDYSIDSEALGKWMDIVRQVRPRQIMAYTVDRPTPMKGLSKMSVQQMQELLQPLVMEGFMIQING